MRTHVVRSAGILSLGALIADRALMASKAFPGAGIAP